MGRGGFLGEFTGVMVDSRSNQVTDVLIVTGALSRHTFLTPLKHVVGAGNMTLYLNVDQEQLADMPGFDEALYDAPVESYTGPPGWDAEARGGANLALDTTVALGPLGAMGTTASIGGYPSSVQAMRPSIKRPMIAAGAAVYDHHGVTVGQVSEFDLELKSGRLTRIEITDGPIRSRVASLPKSWVRGFSDKGVSLNAVSENVETLLAA